MTIKVLMRPHVSEVQNQSNGIARVIEGYFAHLKEFDIELVEPDATTYDLVAAHAGITGASVMWLTYTGFILRLITTLLIGNGMSIVE